MFTNYGETVGHFPVFDTPVDPEEPKPEDPISQDFIFAFKSTTYGETEYKIGDTLHGNLLTADFAKFTLYEDGTATIVADGKTSAGYYEIFGDEIMVELTDASNGSLLNFYLQYDEIENYISFNLSGFTYKFDMPENVTYEDLLGEYVDCQTFYVDKVVSGDNTFKVGDTLLNGNVLTADFVVLKVFKNGLFKLTTPQTTIRGEYEIDRENGIVNAYYLEDDEPSVIEIAMSNHGATLCFDMYGITYYLNVEGYEGGEGPETPSFSSVFYVQSVIFEGETYYVGDQFLGETLSPEWATFNYFESDNTFILSYNGNVIEGSWESVDETLTQLYYTNANGEVCVIDVTLIQETKSLELTIDGYTILFDFTYSEGGDVGGDVNEKVYGVYKLVRFENIVGESAWNYLVGEEFHGEILSEDDFTLTLYRDGSYKIAGYLYAEMEGSFVYEKGELILDLENIQSEYEQISVYFENDNLIFVVADPSEDVKNVYYTTYYGSSDVTGGDDQYEDATWGKVYKAYQVEYNGEVYSFGDTLPNGALIDENWIVVEVNSNNVFYLTISSINYHIKGKWENVYDTLTKLSYIDEEGDECSLYVEVDNEAGLYTLEISEYYITLELHYSSEDDYKDTLPEDETVGSEEQEIPSGDRVVISGSEGLL